MDLMLEIGGRPLCIAGAPWSPETVPANFRPFVRPADSIPDGAARLAVVYTDATARVPASRPLSESYNDLGRAAIYDGGDCWSIVLIPHPGEQPRVMDMDRGLRSATLRLRPGDPYTDFVIDSMARIFFSQHIAAGGDFLVHASAVGCDGRACLFMGKSGTGKSTHSRLWLDTFADAELINDDCPMIRRISEARYLVCGTPWSGKTPCWRDTSLPLAGIVRLSQAPANRFVPLAGVDAFVAFIPGMSVMTADPALYSAASSAALDLTASVAVGRLECLPDADAARMCRAALYSD